MGDVPTRRAHDGGHGGAARAAGAAGRHRRSSAATGRRSRRDAAAAADRQPGPDRPRRAGAGSGPERLHRRDRRRQDDAGAGDRAAGRCRTGRRHGRPARSGDLRRGGVRAPRRVASTSWLRRRWRRCARRARTTLVVARRIAASGRTRALVWGRSCARDDLETLGERLLEVSSQHEARRPGPARHAARLLDSAAGNDKRRWPRWPPPGARCARPASSWPQAREAAADAERRRGELEELVGRVGEAAIDPGEPVAAGARSASGCGIWTSWWRRSPARPSCSIPRRATARSALAGRAAELLADAERFEPALASGGGRAARLVACACRRRRSSCAASWTASSRSPAGSSTSRQRLLLFAELEHRFGTPAADVPARCAEAQAALELIDTGGRRLAELEAALAEADGRGGARGRPRCQRPAARRRSRSRRRSRRSWPTSAWTARGCEVQIEPAELGARGADRAELLPGRQPRAAAGPDRERCLGRRAVADRAGDAGGGPGRGRRGHAAAGRGRRRRGRAHGARGGREADAPVGRRAGAVHHPPAPDRRVWPTCTSGSRRLRVIRP